MSNSYANHMKGWFIPPVTTRYRFYMSCDDQCQLDMGLDPENPIEKTNLMRSGAWINHRNYFARIEKDRPELISDWVSLEEGQPYYIEGRHYEHNGGDHFSVAVEIERDSDAEDHPHQMAEIQYLEFSANGPFETSQLIVEGVDAGFYKLVFMHPTNLDSTPLVTNATSASATADEFKSEIEAWYQDTFGSAITVTLEKFDSNGEPLDEDVELAEGETLDWYKSVYNITMNKYINGKSVSNVMVMKMGATGEITFNMPDNVQLSGAPLSGKFQIDCVNKDGYASASWEFDYDVSAWHLNHWLMMSCHGLRDKIQIWEDSQYPYYENGRAFRLRYYGKRDVGQA